MPLHILGLCGPFMPGTAVLARHQGHRVTGSAVDFGWLVKPGDRVTVECKKVLWRRRKLRAEASMKLDDGTVVCSGTVSGMGVVR